MSSRPALSRDRVVETALRMVEEGGIRHFSVRKLAAELGVAVTAIYWHVGNRAELFDEIVDRVIDDVGTIGATGTTPAARVTSLARALRRKLLARPHLVGLAHERGRTAAMFEPARAALAAEMEAAGLAPAAVARAVRAIEFHVIGSVVLERTAASGPPPAEPVDHAEVFEFTLGLLVNSLVAAP